LVCKPLFCVYVKKVWEISKKVLTTAKIGDILNAESLGMSQTCTKKGGLRMAYDFSKLRGLMREKNVTQAELAGIIGINISSLNAKLNNKSNFTTVEIDGVCEALDISNVDIGRYFFCRKSLEKFKTKL
jgi:DNA-binding Xre family transcriptional regulator